MANYSVNLYLSSYCDLTKIVQEYDPKHKLFELSPRSFMIYINLITLNIRVRFYYYLLYYYRRRSHRILMIMLTRARTHVSILYIIYI